MQHARQHSPTVLAPYPTHPNCMCIACIPSFCPPLRQIWALFVGEKLEVQVKLQERNAGKTWHFTDKVPTLEAVRSTLGESESDFDGSEASGEESVEEGSAEESDK